MSSDVKFGLLPDKTSRKGAHMDDKTVSGSTGASAVSLGLTNVFAITLFVENPQRSKAFYEQVFAVNPVYEDENSAAFKFDNVIVNLLAVPPARELIEPGKVAEGADGARFQLTIGVDDADAVCEQLARTGVELLNGPMDREWGMRTACFTDPDGHIWEVAQQLE
jgi:catechol 2,3-dioxygenase-like lactoylglutathione lyase family enzyme